MTGWLDEVTQLLARHEDGLYTDKEVISVATRILGGRGDLARVWAALPPWVRSGIQETLDAMAQGNVVVFQEMNAEIALKEMTRLHRRLMEAGLLGRD